MSRRAFGLIELLVIIAIIALLIAFLVPAFGKVREAANRVSTVNNLKMAGLAVHNYHDTYRRMPDAYAPGGQYPNADKTLWFHLLPYLEQDNAYNADSADAAVVEPYCSPDDPYNTDRKGKLNLSGNIRIFGYQTYTAEKCNDVGKALKVLDPKTTVKANLTFPRIVDGTSNTFMAATRLSTCDKDAKGNPVHTLINGDPGTTSGGFYAAAAVSAKPNTLYAAVPDIMYQESPKDFDDRAVGESIKCINNPSGVAHSFRLTGLLTALCDGSVRTVTPKMSPATFARALCPGDGNVLGEDWDN